MGSREGLPGLGPHRPQAHGSQMMAVPGCAGAAWKADVPFHQLEMPPCSRQSIWRLGWGREGSGSGCLPTISRRGLPRPKLCTCSRTPGGGQTTPSPPASSHPLQELSLAHPADQRASEVSWGLQHLGARRCSTPSSLTFHCQHRNTWAAGALTGAGRGEPHQEGWAPGTQGWEDLSLSMRYFRVENKA